MGRVKPINGAIAGGTDVPETRRRRRRAIGRGRCRPRYGFIILFGSRAIVSKGEGRPVRTRCPNCRQEADMLPRSFRNWFTLFFIPVFPISGNTPFVECSNCHGQFPVQADALRQQVAMADQQQNQQAITLYNGLRASPANSVALNELMMLYASMREYDQAVSAANQFPQALNSSEQCMVTLGRVYLAQNRHAEALQWFDAALGRNDALAEAQYYKAITLLLMTPPDPARAVAAARAARNLGYPNADDLLRDAEARARGEA